MRFAIFGALALLVAPALMAIPTSAAPAIAPTPGQVFNTPSSPTTVMIFLRTMGQGESTGPHIHHGVEMTYVTSGAVEMKVAGQPAHVYHAGESFMIPREVPHNGTTVGSTPVTLAVTYVIDKGSAPRESVDTSRIQ